MKILSWNCQGLGNPWTGRSLRKIVREQAPNVCFLMETRLDKDGIEKLYGDLPFPNKIILKKPNSGGGLALLWKNDIRIDLINFTDNHILAEVKEEDGFVWWLTCFYGWPEAQHKHKSWELLNHHKTFEEGPWLCIGDFNAFLQSSEKLSKRPAQVSQVEDFRAALEECQLEDLGFKGYPYTWSNKRPGEANTRIRLDRAVATREWRENFQLSSVVHLAPHASDHLPIVLQTKQFDKNRIQGRKGFKFEETWLLWEDCEDVVNGAWSMEHNDGHALAMVQQKNQVL